jgi:hypothetical protein
VWHRYIFLPNVDVGLLLGVFVAVTQHSYIEKVLLQKHAALQVIPAMFEV